MRETESVNSAEKAMSSKSPWYESGIVASPLFGNALTFLTVLIAALTILIQNTAQFKVERESSANQIWLGYMDSAIQYPNIAENVDAQKVGILSSEDKARYAWHAEKMLFSAELILGLDDVGEDWKPTISGEIVRHKYYFSSCEFKFKELPTYSAQVQALIEKVLGNRSCVKTGVKEWGHA